MAKVPVKETQSAKPGTKNPTGKKEKKIRIDHPDLLDKSKLDEKGNPTRKKIAGVPGDFDPKVHKPLRRNDFEKESTWLLIKAEECEKKAKQLRADAVIADTEGSSDDRKKLKRLQAMKDKMAELEKELAEAGLLGDAA